MASAVDGGAEQSAPQESGDGRRTTTTSHRATGTGDRQEIRYRGMKLR
jgi:hypothetical protein